MIKRCETTLIILSLMALIIAINFYGSKISFSADSQKVLSEDVSVEMEEIDLYTLGQESGSPVRLVNCEWSPRRTWAEDQDMACNEYPQFGEGYVMVGFDSEMAGGFCYYNRIKCCQIVF